MENWLKKIKSRVDEIPQERDAVEDLLALLYGQYFSARTAEWSKVFKCGINVTSGMTRYLDQMVHRSMKSIKAGKPTLDVVMKALIDMTKKINYSLKTKDVEWAKRLKKVPATISSAPRVGIDMQAVWCNLMPEIG